MEFFLDSPAVAALVIYAAIAGGMLAFLEWGRRTGRRHLDLTQQAARVGVGAAEASLFALFGLLLAFTFSGAADRFQSRRAIALDEVKAVAATWKRLDHLPEPGRSKLRDLVRRHAAENAKAYSETRNLRKFKVDMDRIARLEDELWAETLSALAGSPGVTMPVTGTLMTMFEKRMARAEAVERHPPLLIYGMLITLGWICAFLTGFGMSEAKARSWTHIAAYAGIISLTLYIIIDLEFPKMGMIRADDKALEALLQTLR
jgi:hypothetical protein